MLLLLPPLTTKWRPSQYVAAADHCCLWPPSQTLWAQVTLSLLSQGHTSFTLTPTITLRGIICLREMRRSIFCTPLLRTSPVVFALSLRSSQTLKEKNMDQTRALLAKVFQSMASVFCHISRGRRELGRRFVPLDTTPSLYKNKLSHQCIFGGSSIDTAVQKASDSKNVNKDLVFVLKKKAQPFRGVGSSSYRWNNWRGRAYVPCQQLQYDPSFSGGYRGYQKFCRGRGRWGWGRGRRGMRGTRRSLQESQCEHPRVTPPQKQPDSLTLLRHGNKWLQITLFLILFIMATKSNLLLSPFRIIISLEQCQKVIS